jgi:hypothetical protein
MLHSVGSYFIVEGSLSTENLKEYFGSLEHKKE